MPPMSHRILTQRSLFEQDEPDGGSVTQAWSSDGCMSCDLSRIGLDLLAWWGWTVTEIGLA